MRRNKCADVASRQKLGQEAVSSNLLEEKFLHVVAAAFAGGEVLPFGPALQQEVVVATAYRGKFRLVLEKNNHELQSNP